MGIRLHCPNGHKVHVKSFLAGKRGVCPQCGSKFDIPAAAIEIPGDTTGDDVAVAPDADNPSSDAGAVVEGKKEPAESVTTGVAMPQSGPARPRVPLEFEGLAQLGGSDLLSGRAFGPAARRLADRQKNARTMRIFSLSLVIAMTLLACILIYMILRSH
jgi:hypothetical protein